MPSRALIIAIEEYPNSQSMANRLPGTNEGALAFLNWLIQKKEIAPQAIQLCAGTGCDGPPGVVKRDTTRKDIIQAISSLVAEGKDNTPEFFFFFSGHGFSFKNAPWGKPVDILVTSNFADLESSGDACLKLQEIQEKLWTWLGGISHYYFIDACRNVIEQDQIEPLPLGRVFGNSAELGRPTHYTIFSTAAGEEAKVASGFAQKLVAGLSGAGRAKGWVQDAMYVTFDLLCRYVQGTVKGQEIDSERRGGGDGFILKLNPTPQSKCEIKIANPEKIAASGSSHRFTLELILRGASVKQLTFNEQPFEFEVVPEDYQVRVSHPGASLVQVDPPPVTPLDLYDTGSVVFEIQEQQAEEATRSLQAHVVLESAGHTEVCLRNLQTGALLTSTGTFDQMVEPGRYLAKVVERGLTIYRHDLVIESNTEIRQNLLDHPASELRKRILAVLTEEGSQGLTEFAEGLGPIANWDLGLWMTLLGAAGLLAEKGRFTRLEGLNLESFEDAKKDESIIYVLAGLEKIRYPIGFALDTSGTWKFVKETEGLVGIFEFRTTATPGPHLLSLLFPGLTTLTFVIHCLPNRATFLTFTEDAAPATAAGPGPQSPTQENRWHLRMYQYLLPVYTLIQYLDPEVSKYLQDNQLRTVRSMFLAQNQFSGKRTVELAENGSEDWGAFLKGEWLDPVMSLIACYEMIRGGITDSERDMLKMAVDNLRRYFSGIPDIEVIAKLSGQAWNLPETPPLLLEGVLAIQDYESELPLPASKLDYNCPWTAWRGALDAGVLKL